MKHTGKQASVSWTLQKQANPETTNIDMKKTADTEMIRYRV